MTDWRKKGRRKKFKASSFCDLPDCGDGCGCDLTLVFLLPTLYRIAAGALRDSAVDPDTRPRTTGARWASRLVRSYQVNVSARRTAPVCNLRPSCSRYGLQMLAEHGVLRAAILVRAQLTACRLAGQAARGL